MRSSTLVLVSLSLLGAPLPAQGKRGPVQRPATFIVNPATQDPTNLVVKFAEGAGVRRRDGQFTGRLWEIPHLLDRKFIKSLYSAVDVHN